MKRLTRNRNLTKRESERYRKIRRSIVRDFPPMKIAHSSLKPTLEGNTLRRACPVCKEGVLLLRRGDDLRLQAEDNCINCGQRFIYTDIERLRNLPEEKLMRRPLP